MRAMFAAALLAAAIPAAAQTPAAPSPAPAVSPAHQAAAERVVAALVPEGIYQRMMRDQFPAMMDAMFDQTMGLKGGDFGATGDDADETLAETTGRADPAFRERMAITNRVMSQEMATLFGRIEPRVRTGLANAMAARFTTAQLLDLDRFFATPSGKAFADQYLLLFVDPLVLREMASATPEILREMPRIEKAVEAATAHLPPVPKAVVDDE